jgi:hypothetical protein
MSEAAPRPAPDPARPAGAAETESLHRAVHLNRFLAELIEAIPDMVLVLNSERQAIAANRQALTTLGKTESLLIGLRPGEILGCVGVAEAPGGCGTGARCGLCGAVQAILASQQTGERVSREARILVDRGSVGALDLLITARPAAVDGSPLTICILRDISDQKRRTVLETLFFHDILNAAGGISGLAWILADTNRCLSPEKEQECRLGMARLSRRLIEEICHQRDLLAAERGVFEPRMEEIDVPAALREVRELYAGHPVARNRSLEVAEESTGTIRSDATIVRRVLGNLVKNALEATPEGGAVRISSRDLGERVALEVSNPGVMPREVQLQVFQRSFSTKADRGRGIGTYSIKLFVERYLQGTVGFTSAEPGGTTFTVTLPKEPAAG